MKAKPNRVFYRATLMALFVLSGWGSANAAVQSGLVAAWGLNDSGQSDVPAGLADVVAISAGEKHSLALKTDGRIAAWGFNFYGQCNVPGRSLKRRSRRGGEPAQYCGEDRWHRRRMGW